MEPFLRTHRIAAIYFVLCFALLVWAEIDCYGARDVGQLVCGFFPYRMLFFLLLPSTGLIDVIETNGELSMFILSLPHREFILLTGALCVNTALLGLVVGVLRRFLKR